MNNEINIAMSLWIRYEYTHAYFISQVSLEKQSRLDKHIYRKKEGNKEMVILRNWLTCLWGLANLRIAGQVAKSLDDVHSPLYPIS